ncbi:MAG: 1-deoxy-D-xylulose-5-phosphate synthase [Thermoleophilia bacterium]|nr:1-deoxy-D-xylulose-5-phosphate synthase [Thermoleophilia bacterium]
MAPERRFPILEALTDPHDVASLSPDALQRLAAEMRDAIIATVSETGGHLGASLGTVELTIALHCELQSPRDKILWDVGHQAYGHKLLTGRLPEFGTLRQHGGMSGFLRREESPHDVMGAGHASTSVSYGVGLAEAARMPGGGGNHVACVIGDGAMTGGMAYEGLNQAGALGTPMVVVLNDNGMSISENVGALARMFQKARVDSTITRVREEMERGLARLPGAEAVGTHLRDATKALWFQHGALFESLGFAYVGPIDGHDIEALRRAIRTGIERQRPVLIHAQTVKGKGYDPAESDVEHMHGATPFDPACGTARKPATPPPPTYTEVFGQALVREAEADPRVIAVTAAMLKGTGTNHMRDRFPERTYDVGIAEQHGVVFACGLAIAGFKPVCAMYSTFLQRAFDPIVHDVALQNLNVVFAIDRGGLVGDDGPTHHGVFDLAYLRAVPNMTIMAPKDEAELVHMLHTALAIDGPVAFRYPRGAGPGAEVPQTPELLPVGRGEVLERGEGVALVGYGHGVGLALQAAELVADRVGVAPTVVNARFCKPLDTELLHRLAADHELIVTVEDHAALAGFGGAVLEALQHSPARVLTLGLPDRFIDHGKRDLLLAEAGLDPSTVADAVARAFHREQAAHGTR